MDPDTPGERKTSMNQRINKAMEEYRTGAKTLEEANTVLKEEHAGYHLISLTEEERKAKNQRENEAGFIYTDITPERLPKKPDMRRRSDLAGRSVIQLTKQGKYLIDYDEDGYANSATRV